MADLCHRIFPYPFKLGYIVFFVAFAGALSFIILLSRMSGEKGVPNSMEGVEGYRNTMLVSVAIFVLAPCGLVLLYFRFAGKFLSMLYWASLAITLGFVLIAVVKSIVWMTMTEEERIEDMLDFSEANYDNHREASKHVLITETTEKCCGIRNFTDYPDRIFITENNLPRVPDHCCTTAWFAKDCGRTILATGTMKWAALVNTTNPPTTCVPVTTPDLTQAEFTEYANLGTKALEDKVRNYVCDPVKYTLPLCLTDPSGNLQYVTQIRKWDWCAELFYSNSTGQMIEVDREFQRIRAAGSLNVNGCFKSLEAYMDRMVVAIFLAAMFLLTFICIMLPVYLHMYWAYRETELRPYPLPLWFDKLPGEQTARLPAGLGTYEEMNEPLAMLDDEQLYELLSSYPVEPEPSSKSQLNVNALAWNQKSAATSNTNMNQAYLEEEAEGPDPDQKVKKRGRVDVPGAGPPSPWPIPGATESMQAEIKAVKDRQLQRKRATKK